MQATAGRQHHRPSNMCILKRGEHDLAGGPCSVILTGAARQRAGRVLQACCTHMFHVSIDSLLQPTSLLLQCLRLAAARTGVQVALNSLQLPNELLLCITDRLESCLHVTTLPLCQITVYSILLQACQKAVPGTQSVVRTHNILT